jgi:hypothetical protein
MNNIVEKILLLEQAKFFVRSRQNGSFLSNSTLDFINSSPLDPDSYYETNRVDVLDLLRNLGIEEKDVEIVKLSESRISEVTRAEFLSNYDGPTPKAPARKYKINPELFSINPKTWTISFNAKDTGPQGSGRQHIVNVVLKDLKHLTRDKDLKNLDRIKLAVEEGDLAVYCTCESYLYHGFQYIDWVLDAGIRKEVRPPKVRNPKEIGISCKHINAVMKQFKLFVPKITQVFTNAWKNNDYKVVVF